MELNKHESEALIFKLIQKMSKSQIAQIGTQLSLMSRVDFIGNLPNELSINILSYLNLSDLNTVFIVNSQWNSIANDNILWRILFRNQKWFVNKLYLESIQSTQSYSWSPIQINSDSIPPSSFYYTGNSLATLDRDGILTGSMPRQDTIHENQHITSVNLSRSVSITSLPSTPIPEMFVKPTPSRNLDKSDTLKKFNNLNWKYIYVY